MSELRELVDNEIIAESESDARRTYRERLSDYKTINASLHDLNWRLADLDDEIAELAVQREVEDAAPLRQRHADLLRWKTALEESIIRQMLQADEIASAVEQARQQVRQES